MATSGNTSVNVVSSGYIKLKFSWETNAQSVANNTSLVAWQMHLESTGDATISSKYSKAWSVTVNGEEYSGKNYITLAAGETILLASGTTTIEHTVDGTKTFSYSFTQEIQVNFSADGLIRSVSGTGNGTLERIARASTLTAGNGTLGTEQILTVNRKSDTFKHRLTYRCGDVSGYIVGSETGYSTLTSISWAPRIGLAEENTTGTSVQIVLTLYSYAADGTHLGTVTKTITCAMPASVKPTCSIELTDVTGWAATYGQPVQGVSRIQIDVAAQTSYGSPIVSYDIDANGAKYPSASATTDVLTATGAFKVNATVKDQRARSGSATASLDVLAYAPPQVSALSVHRCNEDGTENDQGEFVKAVYSVKVTDLGGKNKPAFTIRYKKSTADTFFELELNFSNPYNARGEFIFRADSNASYDVEVTATDNHGTMTRATSASTAFTLMNWNASGTGMAFGKVSEKENAVEFGLDLYDKHADRILGAGDLVDLFMPVGAMVLRYDTIDPGTLYPGTTWSRIDARVLRGGSSSDVIGSEGTIAAGDGRTYINVSVWRRTA
jgi:hypothetical protein